MAAPVCRLRYLALGIDSVVIARIPRQEWLYFCRGLWAHSVMVSTGLDTPGCLLARCLSTWVTQFAECGIVLCSFFLCGMLALRCLLLAISMLGTITPLQHAKQVANT